MGLLNWSGSKHTWNKGTTTVVAHRMGANVGRHRAGLGKCKFHPRRNAQVRSDNGIPLCSTCKHDLG